MENTAAPLSSPLVRIDAFDLEVTVTEVDGTRFRLRSAAPLMAFSRPSFPLFERWMSHGTLTLRAHGTASSVFDARVAVEGVGVGAIATVSMNAAGDFSLTATVPLKELASRAGPNVRIGLVIAPGERTLTLLRAHGHAVAVRPSSGSANSVMAVDGLLAGAADPRQRGTLAEGY